MRPLAAIGAVLVAGSAGAFYSVDGGDWYTRLGGSDFAGGFPMELSGLQFVENLHIVAASLNNGVFLHDGRENPPPSVVRRAR